VAQHLLLKGFNHIEAPRSCMSLSGAMCMHASMTHWQCLSLQTSSCCCGAEVKHLTLLLRLLLLLHHWLLLRVAWVAWHALRCCWAAHSRVGCCCWPHAGVSWLRPGALHWGVATWLLLGCATRVATSLILLWGRAICARRAWGGSLGCKCAGQTHQGGRKQ
jgi:hypothetical protein